MMLQRPDLLWLVPASVALILLAVVLHAHRRRRVARAFGGRVAARRLTGTDLQRAPLVRYLLVTVAGGVVALAATGPRDPEPPAVTPARPVDVVLVVDISASMRATDVAPTRMEGEKQLAQAFLDALPADRVGLVTFAWQSYVVAPPTSDHDVVRFFLDALEPGLLREGDQGTRTGLALRAANDLLERTGSPDADPVVVLLSDGESHDEEAQVMSQVAALRDDGVRVFTVGIGTEAGEPLMELDYRGNPAGPLVGPGGAPVKVGLDRGFLAGLSEAGGGAYLGGTTDDPTGVAAALLDRLGRAARDRTGRPDGRRRDLPYALGLLGLVLLVSESAGDAAIRRRQARLRGGYR